MLMRLLITSAFGHFVDLVSSSVSFATRLHFRTMIMLNALYLPFSRIEVSAAGISVITRDTLLFRGRNDRAERIVNLLELAYQFPKSFALMCVASLSSSCIAVLQKLPCRRTRL